MPAVFFPPVVRDVPLIQKHTPNRDRLLLRHYRPLPRGRTVVRLDGTYTTLDTPEQSLLDPLTQGVDYFLGGHVYVVSDEVAADLVNDGYDVILPGSWSSYSSTAWADLATDFWAGA